MKKQSFFFRPRDLTPHNTVALSTLGIATPAEVMRREGKDWERCQVCRDDSFVINALESYKTRELADYTHQENYIKINFWLSGKHTTVLDGYGQHDHDRPEAFITAGPLEMVKVDLCNQDTQVASLAICLLHDFFPKHMGLELDQLPEPLRTIMVSSQMPYAFHRLPLTPDLLAAARAILSAPFAVRRQPIYAQAKAVELMCLLLNHIETSAERKRPVEEAKGRQEARLHEAWELLHRHYAEAVTLDRVSREVGLNKMALTSGFRKVYGMSVYDCLQKVRMERAYELLKDHSQPVARIAEAVGYRHSCNFSTAFHAHFGCTPQSVRLENA